MNLVEPFSLNTNPVFASLMPRSLDERRAAYADPAWRQQVRQAWAAGEGIPPRWDTFEVMESTAHPELVGEGLAALAAATGADPFDALLELAVAEPDLKALRVRAILANDDPDGVALLLHEPKCTLGLSDAGAHVGQLCDAPLPTDLLGGWVRDRGVLSLEDAVHKLTKVQADLFGLPGRGVLEPGSWADVVVFEPDTVAPGPLRRVRDFPADTERLTADAPNGVRHVLVNGTAIRADGLQLETGTRPGQVVSPAPR
jgi:N-acyl-D-amino-acid deacylase